MKNYEALLILNPRTAEEKIDAILVRLQKRITDNGGEIVKVNKKGIKKLAFTFSKHKRIKDGFFAEIEFKGPGKASQSLMALLRLQEEIIRHMVTVKEEILQEELEAEIVPEETKPAEGEAVSGQPE